LISFVFSALASAASLGKRPSGSKPSSPGVYSALICSVAGLVSPFQPAEMRTDSRTPMARMTNSQNWRGRG